MTVVELLRSLAKRWYVLLTVVALGAGAAYWVAGLDGVYQTKVRLVLLPPASSSDDNTLRDPSESLVHFAALVEREFRGNGFQPRYASIDAPLYGAGVRSGVSVTLPNAGGQWLTEFRDAVLVVESVDPSLDVAVAGLDDAIERIEGIVEQRQEDADVAGDQRITVLVSDRTSGARFADGSTLRSVAAVMLLATALGCVAAVLMDRGVSRRRERRAAAMPAATPARSHPHHLLEQGADRARADPA